MTSYHARHRAAARIDVAGRRLRRVARVRDDAGAIHDVVASSPESLFRKPLPRAPERRRPA